MVLESGSQISPYEILGPLGAGGKGEVYRARDPKLSREVAIKVLPSEMARDPERLSRFRREATLLAALSRLHVAAIHGLEESDGNPFLVLELVEGKDLSKRLKRGPIPVDEALEIAQQIAEALEEAQRTPAPVSPASTSRSDWIRKEIPPYSSERGVVLPGWPRYRLRCCGSPQAPCTARRSTTAPTEGSGAHAAGRRGRSAREKLLHVDL